MPISIEEVEDKIVTLRGQKVLLDRDVAELYGVETRKVNQAVRNNPRKFREGYVFELSKEESAALRSNLLTLEQSLRSNNSTLETVNGKGRHSKYNFKAFTSNGHFCSFCGTTLCIAKAISVISCVPSVASEHSSSAVIYV
ncbi:MAG: ORF6N domain-containing protein [Bacteroidaceae bacterium]|nr:ORF6N domain-containing protein [Bacteroidaceae bacterium]